MKALYFECFSGVSGDMCLGALMGLGVELAYVVSELRKLNLDGWNIELKEVRKNGVNATKAIVTTPRESAHRHIGDIIAIIDQGDLNGDVKTMAKNIFWRLARAEGKAHGVSPEEIHFHEVGAMDSIIDIIGTAICVDRIKPAKIFRAVVNDGYGFTVCAHGKIPIPVPAVVEIFAAAGVKTRRVDVPSELVTPTGAAIISELTENFGEPPAMIIQKVAYGAGERDLDIPNVLRVSLCETDDERAERITVIETNVDDSPPETLGYAMERLFDAGAKDVFFTPIQMKKNRPAVKITVLCDEKDAHVTRGVLLRETGAIGVRERVENRTILPRSVETIDTRYGPLMVKKSVLADGSVKIAPEYESARELAVKSGAPLRAVYNAVKRG
ncbi:MAG: nickel pincer cofactor biosynthesis protein LarC [Clostridiales bacterium]|jgi:uncharacterized protein (TIGR00299 family) protein|nr:nickel pincer cofactor biosynthesis protein LarC [Clostridiales bacterium]